jgi:hypothetical protein
MWVIGQHGPKMGQSAMEDEVGYCVTTGLAMQYGNKKTEHTAVYLVAISVHLTVSRLR